MGFRVLGHSASKAMSWVHDTAVLVILPNCLRVRKFWLTVFVGSDIVGAVFW